MVLTMVSDTGHRSVSIRKKLMADKNLVFGARQGTGLEVSKLLAYRGSAIDFYRAAHRHGA